MTQLFRLEDALKPATPEERDRSLAALELARAHREALLRARGGKLFTTSAGELLDELQDERTDELP
jgi:hypothetical protein